MQIGFVLAWNRPSIWQWHKWDNHCHAESSIEATKIITGIVRANGRVASAKMDGRRSGWLDQATAWHHWVSLAFAPIMTPNWPRLGANSTTRIRINFGDTQWGQSLAGSVPSTSHSFADRLSPLLAQWNSHSSLHSSLNDVFQRQWKRFNVFLMASIRFQLIMLLKQLDSRHTFIYIFQM